MTYRGKPHLVVIAGPNGAGKSTLTSEAYPELIQGTVFINPDEIVKTVIALHPDKTSGAQQVMAAREALKAYDACLSQKQSFSLETTLAGNTPLNTMKKAREQGYHITLAYVGIESPRDSMTRVRERVRVGGHDVPVEDILRRYERSMENLPAAIKLADHILLFDNSKSTHTLHLFLEKEFIREIYQEQQPSWLKERVLENALQKGQKIIFREQHLSRPDQSQTLSLKDDPLRVLKTTLETQNPALAKKLQDEIRPLHERQALAVEKQLETLEKEVSKSPVRNIAQRKLEKYAADIARQPDVMAYLKQHKQELSEKIQSLAESRVKNLKRDRGY
jgi:predicted ABC-type ATPase